MMDLIYYRCFIKKRETRVFNISRRLMLRLLSISAATVMLVENDYFSHTQQREHFVEIDVDL